MNFIPVRNLVSISRVRVVGKMGSERGGRKLENRRLNILEQRSIRRTTETERVYNSHPVKGVKILI